MEITVLMGDKKPVLLKIHFFSPSSKPTKYLGRKFHADFRTGLKMFHTKPEKIKFLFELSGKMTVQSFYNCMGKAGLSLNRYRKKYRPLGRWNRYISFR